MVQVLRFYSVFLTLEKDINMGRAGWFINTFFQIHRKLEHYSVNLKQQRLNYFNNDEDPNHWIACMNPEMEFVDNAVTNSLKVLFDSLYKQHREGKDIIGFKEVRYGEDELTLFRKCYPNAKIILLVRNPIDVWKSMLGAGLGNNNVPFAKKWNKHASYYLELAKIDPNTHLIKYEDIVNKDPMTIETISRLGKLRLKKSILLYQRKFGVP
ncbi:sulfotransferase [Bacillus sp. N9]